ncbi:MFS transporter [Streptomyces griseoluteus]
MLKNTDADGPAQEAAEKAAALVLACQSLPQWVFILLGGVIADRMSRSRLMAIADGVGAFAYAGLTTMTLTRHAPLALMCALAVVAGLATALFAPAMNGVVPLAVPVTGCSRPMVSCG